MHSMHSTREYYEVEQTYYSRVLCTPSMHISSSRSTLLLLLASTMHSQYAYQLEYAYYELVLEYSQLVLLYYQSMHTSQLVVCIHIIMSVHNIIHTMVAEYYLVCILQSMHNTLEQLFVQVHDASCMQSIYLSTLVLCIFCSYQSMHTII